MDVSPLIGREGKTCGHEVWVWGVGLGCVLVALVIAQRCVGGGLREARGARQARRRVRPGGPTSTRPQPNQAEVLCSALGPPSGASLGKRVSREEWGGEQPGFPAPPCRRAAVIT